MFFISAGTFAAMSLYGYSTNRDLSRFGSFLFMGLIGIVLASVVNIFVGSSALQFAILVIGVLLFTGLAAYDTQRIKQVYFAAGAMEDLAKPALMGALTLYLDFINLFVMLLQLTGTRGVNGSAYTEGRAGGSTVEWLADPGIWASFVTLAALDRPGYRQSRVHRPFGWPSAAGTASTSAPTWVGIGAGHTACSGRFSGWSI
jgi:hypothetical protein